MIGAFFDIDGTIYRNSLLTEHFKKMIKYELIDSLEYDEKVRDTYKLWAERKGDYDGYLLSLTETYVNAMIGISEKDNDFVSDQVLKLKGEMVYRYTRERIKWHREQGHKVIFISGSPDFLVSRMAKKWGADDFCGSGYHVTDGKFDGGISPMWDSRNKIKSINRFVEKYDIDLSKSYAYGDTSGDYSMLKSVGNPITINPSKEFLDKLRADKEICDKVQVIVERKDVIYKMKLDVEDI